MTDYISREAFIAEQRHLYCDNCARRKGMKRGKMRFVYEIGDAPCKSCGYNDVLDDLEDYPAADVRPVVRGKWLESDCGPLQKCSICKATGWYGFYFCPNCGADMREES